MITLTQENNAKIDNVLENPKLIEILLKDRTTKENIIWATDSYAYMGDEYQEEDYIKENLLKNGANNLIRPRVEKELFEQKNRTRGKAEVFTPTWVVKKQNDLVEADFNELPLQEYIEKTWLELACGEAPYMVTRYDTVSGKWLDLNERVGFVDRKLQRITKETFTKEEWLKLTYKAYQASYGYEFQGDSLFLARENLLYTFIDYYLAKFNEVPMMKDIEKIAKIISYNVFQMDGLKYIIPLSEVAEISEPDVQLDLFGEMKIEEVQLEMSVKEGQEVKIKKWSTNRLIPFKTLIESERSTMPMKFDVVIGNPPYQENDRGERADGSVNASASPIYPYFVESSTSISQVQSFIIPARWLTGAGKGLKKFSERMFENNRFKSFNYYANSKDVFPNNEITGGVCFFIRDNLYNGATNISSHFKTKKEKSIRIFDEHKIGVFIPFESLSKILLKVMNSEDLEENNIQKITSTLKPYGLRTDFFMNQEKYGLPKIEETRTSEGDIEVFGLKRGKRTSRFIPHNYPIPRGQEMISKYKVFLPYAYGGDGRIGESEQVTLLGQPLIGKPNQISTETYLNIGHFDTEEEAVSLYKYIKTKFFRVLISILKSTQHATRTFRLVPIQDFTSNSDIDWTKSITEIDQQLYQKYELSQDEIKFIEENVREME